MGVSIGSSAPRARRLASQFRGLGALTVTKIENPAGATVPAEHLALQDFGLRNQLAIGAGVALSVGLSIWLSSSSRGWQQAGAAITGAGILAALGAAFHHWRASETIAGYGLKVT